MAGKVLSIEVGYALTKVCEMDYRAKKPRVYHYFSVPTPDGILADGMITVTEEFVNLLKTEMANNKMRTKDAVFTISSSKIASREIKIPYCKESNIGNLVKMNLSDYFPIDVSRYLSAYSILEVEGAAPADEEEKGKAKPKPTGYRLLILAAPEDIIESYKLLAAALKLNVKEIVYMDDLSEYMTLEYKPNFKVAGKLFGKDIKAFGEYLSNITIEDIKLLDSDNLVVTFNDTEYKVTSDLVDKRINSKDGYNVAVENNNVIILNTELSQDLLNEGLARETISKVQNMRKSNGFDIADRINIYYSSNDEYSMNIKDYLEFIRSETLAINIERVSDIEDITDINEYKVGIRLERIEK